MLIIVLTLFLYSCDNNVILSKQPSRFIASVHVHKISDREILPDGVKELLTKNPTHDFIKFPLPYFLVPEEHADYIRAQSFDIRISDQLILMVSGTKYHKMFIHPDSEVHYEFLKRAYRYLDSNETEFIASEIGPEHSLVVWNKKNLLKRAFVLNFDAEKEKIQLIGLVLTFKKNSTQSLKGQSIRSIASKIEESKLNVKAPK